MILSLPEVPVHHQMRKLAGLVCFHGQLKTPSHKCNWLWQITRICSITYASSWRELLLFFMLLLATGFHPHKPSHKWCHKQYHMILYHNIQWNIMKQYGTLQEEETLIIIAAKHWPFCLKENIPWYNQLSQICSNANFLNNQHYHDITQNSFDRHDRKVKMSKVFRLNSTRNKKPSNSFTWQWSAPHVYSGDSTVKLTSPYSVINFKNKLKWCEWPLNLIFVRKWLLSHN